MTRTEIIHKLKAHKAALNVLGVAHLALFGSRARNEGNEASDVDVLIDFEDSRAFREPITKGRAELEVSGTLSEITGLDVSLVDRSRLDEAFRARIEDDLVVVF